MNTTPERLTVARLTELAGRTLAPTEWITVTRELIGQFADCTGDHQFIHVDAERTRAQAGFPDVLAHGFLLLSLAASAKPADEPLIEDAALMLNYGIDRLRFISPVFAGQRVRYRTVITAAETREHGRMLLKRELTLEVEGRDEPALVATLLVMVLPQRPD
ncbi:MAG: MaoC family dehydratase [Nevskiaceae bacterium]|jgi:acyl dehydratase|nr:MaoC family dehydratase [Nevskiaceae bacterium]